MNTDQWRLVDRFKEPSSWASLAAGLATVGIVIPSQWVQVVSLAGSALCVVLGIVLKEKTQ